jgi:hypothetical protein
VDVNGGNGVRYGMTMTCPECREPLHEHAPFDPDLLHRGLFRSAWRVLVCDLCGHVERDLPVPRAKIQAIVSRRTGSATTDAALAVNVAGGAH